MMYDMRNLSHRCRTSKVPTNLGLLAQKLQLAVCCFTEDEAVPLQTHHTSHDVITTVARTHNFTHFFNGTSVTVNGGEDKAVKTPALTLMVIRVPSSAPAVSQLEMNLSLRVHA